MAIAVESAPTSTALRRNEDDRLREASMASTPATRRSRFEEMAASPLIIAGMANAEAAINSSAAA